MLHGEQSFRRDRVRVFEFATLFYDSGGPKKEATFARIKSKGLIRPNTPYFFSKAMVRNNSPPCRSAACARRGGGVCVGVWLVCMV